jgi:nucleoside-diphosphate-sugar epimerase
MPSVMRSHNRPAKLSPGFRGALVYGPGGRRYRGLEALQRLRPLLLISRFISQTAHGKGEQLMIYGGSEGEGEWTRDFAYVKDVVK